MQLIIYESLQGMSLYRCRVSQITPRGRKNFIANGSTSNFSGGWEGEGWWVGVTLGKFDKE